MSTKSLLFLYVTGLITLNACEKDLREPVPENRPAQFSWLADHYSAVEEKPIGTVHARLEGMDEDGDPIFFSIAENDSFEIDSTTGEITNKQIIDVDDVGGLKYFYLHISVYDTHGEGESQNTTMRIVDSNSDNPAPEIEGPTSFSIQENKHEMVATFFNTSIGSWHLQDTTMGVFWLYPIAAQSVYATAGVSLHATHQDFETLPNTFTGTLVYTYPPSGQQSFLFFTLEITNELDPF